MSFNLERLGTQEPERDAPVLRVCIDANVWISYLSAVLNGKRRVPTDLVDMMFAGKAGGIPLQLFLSLELLDTLERVLTRLNFSAGSSASFLSSVTHLMRTGPEQLEPPLFLTGRDQLAMHDREDAGVLGSCIAARVGLLVTDNLKDFTTNDSERIDTQEVTYRTGGRRQLYAIVYERADNVSLAVMHPIDALSWLHGGNRPTALAVKRRYA